MKKCLKIVINILFVVSCITCLGVMIASFIFKDFISVYNLGNYMSNIGLIYLICAIFIFLKTQSSKYLK